LAFFAFFAFFAFLAIASSSGLMGGNATRGMLGGGPTSQHPQPRSQQIRGRLPRTVTQASSRYPQLLWILMRFRRRNAPGAGATSRGSRTIAPSAPAPSRLTMRQQADRSGPGRGLPRAIFINSKPRRGLRCRGSESVKRRGCMLLSEDGHGGLGDDRGDRTMGVLISRC
jgi:hypothetical protein